MSKEVAKIEVEVRRCHKNTMCLRYELLSGETVAGEKFDFSLSIGRSTGINSRDAVLYYKERYYVINTETLIASILEAADNNAFTEVEK